MPSPKSAMAPPPGAGGGARPDEEDVQTAVDTAGAVSRPTAQVTPVARYPSLRGSRAVTVGVPFVLSVSLTEQRLDTATLSITPGAAARVDAEGRLEMDLSAQASSWSIGVILVEGDFTSVGEPERAEQTIELAAVGDSTIARFPLRLDQMPSDGVASLNVLLYDGRRLIAQVGRSFPVADVKASSGTSPAASAAEPAPAPAVIANGSVTSASVRGLAAEVSPHLRMTLIAGRDQTAFVAGVLERKAGDRAVYADAQVPWRTADHAAIVRSSALQIAGRGLQVVGQPAATRDGAVRALGQRLWDVLPPVTKDAIAELLAAGPDGTLEVHTNDPAFPWELVVPPDDGLALGARLRIGRWHVQSGEEGVSIPRDTLPLSELVVVAPEYAGSLALPASAREVDALSSDPAFVRVPGGRYADLRPWLDRGVKGVLHFAGHGFAEPGPAGTMPTYALLLADGPVSTDTWLGSVRWTEADALVFVNACDTGQAEEFAGLVEGWGPTVLKRGAAGYIGALWPVGDASAARFADAFYGEVRARMADSGRAQIADVLRALRARPEAAADPTWMAYVYYGSPAAVFVRP